MRTYLVVIDETPEAEVALRFAARRALKTGGAVEILVIAEKAEFIAWGGIQAELEGEARDHAETVMGRALDMMGEEGQINPSITIRKGRPHDVIREAIAANSEISALVLGAAASGPPGPLVRHFAEEESGSLAVPIMIVPGGLSREALDRLS
jgi:nucleotide-binding universal stress UspA family protein